MIMSEKDFLKEKDLLLNSIEKNTVEHWENYYSNVPTKCFFEDLVIDINEIKRLTEENQKYKEVIDKVKHILNNLNDYREFVDIVNAIEDIVKEVE